MLLKQLKANDAAIKNRQTSITIHNKTVKDRIDALTDEDAKRKNPFSVRRELQHKALHLPLYPTTAIGSFPQTTEVRQYDQSLRHPIWRYCNAADGRDRLYHRYTF